MKYRTTRLIFYSIISFTLTGCVVEVTQPEGNFTRQTFAESTPFEQWITMRRESEVKEVFEKSRESTASGLNAASASAEKAAQAGKESTGL